MSFDQIAILALIGGILALFIWGRWRYDLIAFTALLVAVVIGLVEPIEAFVGFGHPAVITVAAVLVISRALQNSGVVDMIAIRLEAATGQNFSPHVDIPKPDGIMERARQLVLHLAQEHPAGRWEQFLTPDGAAYYERCVRILADVEETEQSFRNVTRGPQGRLRIDVPGSIGRLMLLPNLCDFYSKYPDIELVMGMGDRPVDLVQEAVDCVIRIGDLQDSSMVARRIGTFQTVTCAAPSYLERHGVPHPLEDLQQHQSVHYFSGRTGNDQIPRQFDSGTLKRIQACNVRH